MDEFGSKSTVFTDALTPNSVGISCAEHEPTSIALRDTSEYNIHILLSKTFRMSQLGRDWPLEFFVVVCLSILKKKGTANAFELFV